MQIEKRLILIVFGMISLFLIAGCGRGGDVIGGAPTTPFLGGSQGLDIKFLKGAPPEEVTDVNFPFQAIVSIKNIGEYNIIPPDQGVVALSDKIRVDLLGILASDFGVTDVDITSIPLDGAPTARKKDSEGNIIEATETFATIPKSNKQFRFGSGKISGNTRFTFRAEVCYQYQTNAVAQICALKNMIDIADDAICDPSGSKSVFSSGSPIGVTAFRQNVVGENNIQFSFDIVHSGSGSVFEFETISATSCPKTSSQRRLKEDKVKVTVNTGISGTLRCVGVGEGTGLASGDVRLVNGKRTITCTQALPVSRIDFEKNADITLQFNYLDKVDRNVLVKHLGLVGITPTPTLPPPPGLAECGTTVETESIKCKPTSCTQNFDNCQPITANICTCSSGFVACTGTCSLKVGAVDNDPPKMGSISPTFAFGDGSQYFVIQDVFDTGSGIDFCTIIPSDGKETLIMERQGPEGCRDAGLKCDFVGVKSSFAVPVGIVDLQAKCFDKAVDADGNPKPNQFTKTQRVQIRRKAEAGEELPENPNVPQNPEIGELVTNVAEYGKRMRVVVTGIRDRRIGLDQFSCKLFTPPIDPTDPTQIGDELVFNGVTRKGKSIVMELEGPLGCRGTTQDDNVINGPCSATIQHTFKRIDNVPLSGHAPSIQIFVTCTNRANFKNTVPFLIKMVR